ncbi:similar to Aspergillus niger An14g01190 arginase [Maudiozyma saulgeensis]|uniref:Similar to Aspergillus niger An14g01190 arginase n=1 Tax=Maudiozyma saulgeensis TaxID=1789683 RepID=A0A1X7RBC7_9SACH|nr:similar to Aspergillus niger An14g01190 arginase [Kazachstania saulgeensis]
MNKITIIFSPYHVGQRDFRVGNGPNRILGFGIVDVLEKLGYDVNIVEIPRVDEYEGEIGKSFEILNRTSVAVKNAVCNGTFPLVLSGNCMATTGVACGLREENLGFIYFDAHDDLDSPDVNTNGYLDAMGLSMLRGESWKAHMSKVPYFKPIKLDKFLYCGLRDCDETQIKRVKEANMNVIWGDKSKKVDFIKEFQTQIQQIDYSPAVVHLDLDCLDAAYGKVNDFPSEGGLYENELLECIGMVPQYTTPRSLTICSFDPDCGDGDRIAQIAVEAVKRFFTSLSKKK